MPEEHCLLCWPGCSKGITLPGCEIGQHEKNDLCLLLIHETAFCLGCVGAFQRRSLASSCIPNCSVELIQRVPSGQAGVLKRGEGETIQAIRCRLAAAVEALGKERQVRQHRQHRLLLGAGDPAPRQALQRPDRVVSRRASWAQPRICSLIRGSCHCPTSFLHAGWAKATRRCGTRGRWVWIQLARGTPRLPTLDPPVGCCPEV